MQAFGRIPENELNSRIQAKEEMRFQIDEDTVRFKDSIPQVDFSKPQEVSVNLVFENSAEDLEINSGKGIMGKYTRFIVNVYDSQGKIYYKNLDQKTYEVHIVWPRD
jgi:hypothetical protein